MNGSPHSVCVSLPTLRDVVAYEEKEPATVERMTSGYPRFKRHRYVEQLTHVVEEEHGLAGRSAFLVASERRARELIAFVRSGKLIRGGEYSGVHFASGDKATLDAARLFVQHTGCGISSREAASALGLPPHPEDRVTDAPGLTIRRKLQELYGAQTADDIFLTRGGMNAFYSAFKILRDEQALMGRVHWIQLGWLYVDTACVLEKMLPVGGRLLHHYDVANLAGLAELLRFYSPAVAGIVTEVPTNPLVQTCPLEELHALARRYGVALILDPTIASPHNVNILPYSDAHVNSLTKYAASNGDVMTGAVATHPASPFYRILSKRLPLEVDTPATPDLERLAWEIQSYEPTVEACNANTRAVVEFLREHPKVDQVWWALHDSSAVNYLAISRSGAGPGAIVTFTVKGPMSRFYDAVPLIKSPSFGTQFTMLCPFMYLAHYELVREESGRRLLARLGLPPDLIRLSVGTEPAAEIIAALSQGLDAL